MIVSTNSALVALRPSRFNRLRRTVLMPLLLILSVLLGGWHTVAVAAEEFLEPDQAFKLSARSPDGASVELHYQIAPGYYLYRERFAIEAGPADVKLAEAVYPHGKIKFDETFQKDVESYRDTLRVIVPVLAGPAQFKLAVTSQGCADAGLCYPPRQQVMKVQVEGGAIRQVELMADEAGLAWKPATSELLPITAQRAAASPAAASPDTATAALQSGSLWTIAGVFLLAGVLLSFTPCVLPMVPILSSIIVGQGEPVSRWRGLGLSVSYSLGMALVYTLFGVAAGLAGEGLAAALQNPWVLGAFALLLVGLSLSMFGYYELALPHGLQSRLAQVSSGFEGGRHLGVFAMGGVSALIVGPCVAAPLAGALVYISQTRDVLLGAVALFAMACGMSLPLLLVGVSAGSLLPHSGAWMESVKRFFGVLLIAVALWMVTPVLPVWLMMAAWGSLMLVSASYLGLLEPLAPTARRSAHLGKGLALVLAIGGAAQWLGMLSGGRSILQPLSHLVSSASAEARGAVSTDGSVQASPARAGEVSFQRVKSVAELDALLLTAGKPVMLDFYADWCVSCKEFEQFTFRDPQVRARLAGAVLVQADVTANDTDDRALLKRFQLFGPPGIVFFDPQGQEQAGARVIGYQNAQQFLRSLQTAGL